MSGVNRNVLADIAEQGKTGEEAMKAMSPEALRAETGTAEEAKKEGEGK